MMGVLCILINLGRGVCVDMLRLIVKKKRKSLKNILKQAMGEFFRKSFFRLGFLLIL